MNLTILFLFCSGVTSTLKTIFTETIFAPQAFVPEAHLAFDLFLIELPILEPGSQAMD